MIATPANTERVFPAEEWSMVVVGVVVVVAVGVAGEVVVVATPEDGVADEEEVGGAVVVPDSTVTASFIPLPQCPGTPHIK